MKQKLILIAGLALIFTGCNIFSWTSSSSDDLYYEGIKLFNEKKFDEAKQKFAEAMAEDPERSDYRYYHAKATVFESTVNFLSVARDVTRPPQINNVFLLPLYSKEPNMTLAEDRAYKNEIYQVVTTCHRDIEPIFKQKTHGTIKKEDIKFEYSLFSLSRGILQFRDTNNDGMIDENDIYFMVYSPSDRLIDYQVVLPPDFDPNEVADAVKNSVLFLGDGVVALVETFASEYIDTEELEDVMNQLKTELNSIINQPI